MFNTCTAACVDNLTLLLRRERNDRTRVASQCIDLLAIDVIVPIEQHYIGRRAALDRHGGK